MENKNFTIPTIKQKKALHRPAKCMTQLLSSFNFLSSVSYNGPPIQPHLHLLSMGTHLEQVKILN